MNDNTDSNTINNIIDKNETSLTINDIIIKKLKCCLAELQATTGSLECSINENINKSKIFYEKKEKLAQLLAESEKLKNEIHINKVNILISNRKLIKSNLYLKKFNNMARDNNHYNQHIKGVNNNILKSIEISNANKRELLINQQSLSNNIIILDKLREDMNATVHDIGNNIDFRIKKGKETEDIIKKLSTFFTELNGHFPLTESQDKMAREIDSQYKEILFKKIVSMGEINDILKEVNEKIEEENNKSYKDVLDFRDKVATYLKPIPTNDVLNNTIVSFNCKTDISYDILFNRNITKGCNILITTTMTKH